MERFFFQTMECWFLPNGIKSTFYVLVTPRTNSASVAYDTFLNIIESIPGLQIGIFG